MKLKNAVKKECFESLVSTNEYAKTQKDKGECLWVRANSQTGGRGTKGRSFSSQEGGLYVTALLFYENFPAQNAFQIMQRTAAAVCETLSAFGVRPKIKWPNDIYVNGKKICGILIENTFSGAWIASSVVGVGLNVHNQLEKELLGIATTLKRETGKEISVREVEETLFSYLFEENIQKKYSSYLGWLGEKAVLIMGETAQEATLLAVDERGNLLVETGEGRKLVSAGEVSLKIKN